MFNKILIVVLIAILCLACVFQGNYLSHSSGVLLETLALIKEAYYANDFSAALAYYDVFIEKWDSHEQLFSSLLEHAEVDLLHVEIKSIGAWLRTRDTVNLPASFAKLEYYLSHLPSQDSLSMENIL